MRKTGIIAAGLALSLLTSCGYSGRDGEAVGQAKKLSHITPMFCADYWALELSLGVMRNGTGSMSTQDIWLNVTDPAALPAIREAVARADIIKVHYDTMRFPFCTEDFILDGGIEAVPQ